MKALITYLKSKLRRFSMEHKSQLEALNTLLFDSSQSMMLILNEEGEIEKVNRQCEKHSGYDKSEILGLKSGDFFRCVTAWHSRGGCGMGQQCDACPIRNAITRAFDDQEEATEIKAKLETNQGITYDILFSIHRIQNSRPEKILLVMNDMTEIVSTKEALNDSRLKYEALFDQVDEAILVYNKDKQLVRQNNKAKALFGDEDVMSALPLSMFLKHGAEDESIVDFQACHDTKTLVKNNGETFVADLNVTPVWLSDERYIYVNIKDISHTVALKSNIVDSQLQLESIFKHTPSLLCLMTRDGEITKINKKRRDEQFVLKGQERFNHYDAIIDCLSSIKDSLDGISKDYCMHCSLKTDIIEAIKEHKAVYRKEAMLLSHRGIHDQIYVVFSVTLINESSDDQLLIAVEDVTEQRKAREEIHAREVKYRTLFETSRDGICLLDLEGNYLDANNAFLNLVGYDLVTLQQLNYRDITPIQWVFIEERYVDEELMHRGYISTYEKQYNHKDGHKVDVEISAFSIQDDALKKPIICAIVRDTSEKKVLIKQIRESQKMQAIGLLAGGIAHDFNNILAGMMGYTELALLEKIDNQKISNYLSQVLKAGDRAKKLVHQILTFSRQGGGDKSVIHPSKVIEEVVELVRASSPASIKIDLELSGEAPIYAEATNIHEAVMNLATNAIHAVGMKGYVKVSLEDIILENPMRGVIGTLPEGAYVKITVMDEGCGIDEKQIKTIFDPFFTTRTEGDGTGLGLSVVYGIMHGHDGDIVITSQVNKGTTISLYFPRSYEKAQEDKEIERVEHADRLKILFLDDEPLLVDLAGELFKKLGHKVITTTTADEVLEILNEGQYDFDLIVTDYAMPLMNGVELIEVLRQKGIDIPAIICSGNVDMIDNTKMVPLKIVEVLSKPIKINEFERVLSRITSYSDSIGGS